MQCWQVALSVDIVADHLIPVKMILYAIRSLRCRHTEILCTQRSTLELGLYNKRIPAFILQDDNLHKIHMTEWKPTGDAPTKCRYAKQSKKETLDLGRRIP